METIRYPFQIIELQKSRPDVLPHEKGNAVILAMATTWPHMAYNNVFA
jgi:hypothetical protein